MKFCAKREIQSASASVIRLAASLTIALTTSACMGTPSPLAPQLAGTIGVPHNGVLTTSKELPASGAGYVRYRPRSPIYFGLPRLVNAIERAAAVVDSAMPGGAPLVVGDLSAETGGRIPRHNSHRTGRDVDFLFYLTTPTGLPIRNPGFISLGADGFVKLPDENYALLDISRQWLLIRTLILDPEADIQFLFISRELEARIIEYAIARETDFELVWHAQTVMTQPGDSLPHADHLHVRIACKPEEAVYGCTGGGPHWPWLEAFPQLEGSEESLWVTIGEEDPFELLALPSEPAAPDSNDSNDPALSELASSAENG